MINLDDDPPSALPRGTRLGEFELKRVLGVGGFGIVYLAFDHALEREVAIKEYMPAQLAGRTASFHVSLLSQSHAESFSLGLKSFVNEARLLARFDHPSLVKVHRYWEGNNTAYMAMPYYTGHNLHAVRRQLARNPDQAWLLDILRPLLGAVERLHQEGVYHRDISPDNIILAPDGRPVLLDFGAARRVLADKSVALTAILKPAYAPIEQYGESSSVKQGPWTDLYAMGATLHYLLLGRAPLPSTSRALDDEMPPLAAMALDGCTPDFLLCMDWMLKPRPADRPQSVAALRARLDRLPAAPVTARPDAMPDAPDWQRTQIMGRGVAPGAVRTDSASSASPGDSAAAPTLLDLSQLRPADAAAPTPAPPATLAVSPSRLQAHAATEVLARPVPPAAAAPEPAPEPEHTPTQRVEAGAAAPATPTAPPPAPVLPTPPARAPATASARTEPTLTGRSDARPEDSAVSAPLDGAAVWDGERRPGLPADRPAVRPGTDGAPRPAERSGSRRWPLLAGVAGAAGLALWLGLKPAPAGNTASRAADTAASAVPALAAAAEPASASNTLPVPVAAITGAAGAVVAVAADAAPSAAPVTAAVAAPVTATVTAPATPSAAPKAAQRQPPPSPKPAATPVPAPAVPVAPVAPVAPVVAPVVAGGPPSLATSITRLPPAPEATPTAQRTATADPSRTATTGTPAGNSPTGAAPAAAYPAPAAAPAPSSAPAPAPAVVATVTAPRAAAPAPTPPPATARQPDRDAEPVVVQARALSPSERCEGRVMVALWVCIERQCRSDASLRDHPDCAKARREQEQRSAPR